MQPIELAENESRLKLLELADTVREDEYGTSEYEFIASGVRLKLQRNRYDGDTNVTLEATGQLEPVVVFELKAFKHLRIHDRAGLVTIELQATSALEPRIRGTYQSEAGIQVTVRPYLRIEPYFRSQQAVSDLQDAPSLGDARAA